MVAVRKSFNLLSRREQTVFILLSIARAFIGFVDVAAIGVFGVAIAISTSTVPQFLLAFFEVEALQDYGLPLFVFAATIFLGKSLVGIWVATATARFLARVELRMAQKIVNEVFLSGGTEIKNHSASEAEWAILRSTEFAFPRLLGQFAQLTSEASLAAMVIVLFIATNPTLALSVIAYFSLLAYGFQLVTKKVQHRSGESFKASTLAFTTQIGDMFSAYKELFVTEKLTHFAAQLSESRERIATAMASNLIYQTIPRQFIEAALVIGSAGFFSIWVTFSLEGISLSTVGIFVIGSLRLLGAVVPLQRASAAITFWEPQARQAQDILASIKSHSERNRSGETPSPRPISPQIKENAGAELTFKAVSFAYPGAGAQAADQISFSANAGEIVALIGQSGAGKSTILDLAVGLRKPESGTVLIDGMAPSSFRTTFLGAIGYVPQKPGMLAGSIARNVSLCDDTDNNFSEERIWSALRFAELESFVESLPNGIHSSLGKQSDEMSGGQLQRIGIARALYNRPRLLLLDEATSALDSGTQKKIGDTLLRLRGRLTILVVAHRLSTIRSANSVKVVGGGRILESGTLEELKVTSSYVRSLLASEERS